MCRDMPRFGGPGKKKKRCLERKCSGQNKQSGCEESHAIQDFGMTISKSDLDTLLTPLKWLNDQVC